MIMIATNKVCVGVCVLLLLLCTLRAALLPPLPPASTNKVNESIASVPPSGQVMLCWSYPSNQLSDDMSFVIEATNNFGSLPWTSVANPPAYNCLTRFDGTNYWFATLFQIQPGQMFFTCYASNFWGLSTTSNVASTPYLPVLVAPLSITRTN
jgi:hypothetical protein